VEERTLRDGSEAGEGRRVGLLEEEEEEDLERQSNREQEKIGS